MISQGSGNKTDQPIFSRLWGSGFLPTQHQGVRFRSGGDPVLYLSNPPGIDADDAPADARRRRRAQPAGRPSRSATPRSTPASPSTRWPSACRRRVPELTDLSQRAEARPRHVRHRRQRASTAASPATACWPGAWPSAACASSSSCTAAGTSTATCPSRSAASARTSTSPSAALVKDLKQRGLLDDTLVIWGGEFGRTVYSQGALDEGQLRPRPPRPLLHASGWPAAASSRASRYGETDDFCYNIVEDPVHIHDLNATILHCLGIDHTRLTYRFQGRDFRLTDVHGNVVKDILA